MDCAPRQVACPICCSGGISRWRERETVHGRFAIDRCSACGYAFVNPRPSAEDLSRFYQGGRHAHDGTDSIEAILSREAAYPNSTVDARRMISMVRRWVAPPATLLDVGCEYGFFSAEARRRGFEVTAIDLSGASSAAVGRISGVDPIRVSFEEYRPDREFAVVLLSQVLEHAHDVNAWIAKAAAVLEERGVLAIALPNFDSIARLVLAENAPYLTPPEHLNFFTAGSLRRLLRRHGLGVVRQEMSSRFPQGAVGKRLGRLRGLARPIHFVADVAMKGLNGTPWAMMLHTYARKRGRHVAGRGWFA